jgi:hypothetical protein
LVCTNCNDPDYAYDGVVGVCNFGCSRYGSLGSPCQCHEKAVYEMELEDGTTKEMEPGEDTMLSDHEGIGKSFPMAQSSKDQPTPTLLKAETCNEMHKRIMREKQTKQIKKSKKGAKVWLKKKKMKKITKYFGKG